MTALGTAIGRGAKVVVAVRAVAGFVSVTTTELDEPERGKDGEEDHGKPKVEIQEPAINYLVVVEPSMFYPKD